jgi:hypothetical protein
VKGNAVIAPPQLPVSAGICFDAIIMTTIVRHRIVAERDFSFIGFPPLCLMRQKGSKAVTKSQVRLFFHDERTGLETTTAMLMLRGAQHDGYRRSRAS